MAKRKQTKEIIEQVEEIPVLESKELTEQEVENQESKGNLDHMFTLDVSNYGIKKDEAEKLINTAIKFYFENKDKSFSEENAKEVVIEQKESSNDLITVLDKFEKELKLYNYIPKQKVLSFIKNLRSLL